MIEKKLAFRLLWKRSPRVGIQAELMVLWSCCMGVYMLFSLPYKVSADLSVEWQLFL